MKNTLKNGQFSFLIYQKRNKFIGICKETGYIEEGNTPEEVLHRLTNGTKAIFLTVKDDPNLLPSINQNPPLKYKFLFYWIPIYYSLINIYKTYQMKRFELTPLDLCKQA